MQKQFINIGIMKYIRDEISVARERDSAFKKNIAILLCAVFRAVSAYRLANYLYKNGFLFAAKCIAYRAARKTGIEIHPGAEIGKGFFIDHGNGIVIGETCIIGDNVMLYQGVTLGGTGKESGKRHPTIKDNVLICAGAKILGSVTIGENSKIGAGTVVLHEVPENSTVVGVPGRIIPHKKVAEKADRIEVIRQGK